MRPTGNLRSDFIQVRTMLAIVLVAVAVGGIASATVILSLAWPPTAERSSYVPKLDATTAPASRELPTTLASEPPEAAPTIDLRPNGDAVAPVQTTHKLGVAAWKAQNHWGRMASRGKHHYRNFARYFAPRFSASW